MAAYDQSLHPAMLSVMLQRIIEAVAHLVEFFARRHELCINITRHAGLQDWRTILVGLARNAKDSSFNLLLLK